MFDVSPVPVGTTPTLLGNFTERTVTVVNPSGAASTVYIGSGTASTTSSNGVAVAAGAQFGPHGPLTGQVYAVGTAATNVLLVVTSI